MRVGTHLIELAAPRVAIPAHETEREAKVHQLDDREELAWCLLHLPELVEERIRAAHAWMESRHQRLLGPAAGGAPGRVQHYVVDARTERVVRGSQQFHRDAGLACLALEGAQVVHGAFAQCLWIQRPAGHTQASEQLQKR